jgi:hypothetical protein
MAPRLSPTPFLHNQLFAKRKQMSLVETGNETGFITFCQHWYQVWDETEKWHF